ncbi:histidinol-phosphatase HisJ family protein [Clostridium psychrophilum]|uniref:histidinol-phosphatase HisJ family protein n=1 Tax=Clostridium psychrophilum TaxID=132926 RepID=UPI001C0E310D|nr:histidinol-phosphatase HisJ family protein [Clostridium psychrophilum]MBU3182354.1 histidinol-phosphatase HisJ family protein [Clostridium psychrophilum]
MNITDHHVHTEFSGDCDTPMEVIINKAKELGLKEVMFTDHMDFDYPSKDINFEVDYKKYIKVLEKLRIKYKEMDILMGIEVGYQPGLNESINKLLNSYDFDFVICSIHAWNGAALDKGDLFKGRTQQEGYRAYFECLKYTLNNFDNFDVVGHLDFINRYGDFANKTIRYDDYKNILDEILSMIINKGKGIELNTSGLRYKLNSMHPSREILKRYLELGGKIITIGSDAHVVKDLCADFDKAIMQLKEIGFKEITTFKNRKLNFIKI